jgi:hypothetical protein
MNGNIPAMGTSESETEGKPGGPGPIYDAAMRGVVEGDPAAFCRLLDIAVSTGGGQPELLSASFASPERTLHADLLLRVGPTRLVHVEYERRPSVDLIARMFVYLLAILNHHSGAKVSQHVVVLGTREIREYPGTAVHVFWKSVSVCFLRDVDPARFLKEVSLAPMAALGRGDDARRTSVFAEAVTMIRDGGGSRMQDLLEFAATLASIVRPLRRPLRRASRGVARGPLGGCQGRA